MRERLGWLVAPATSVPEGARDAGLAALRILVGLMWLYNVAWKRAADFGETNDNGLYYYTALGVDYPVLAPYSWLIEQVILPNITLFGYGVILAETTLAVLLLTGTAVRLAAVLGIAQSAAIALSVAFAPQEWPWSYWLMIGAHVVLLLGTAGRTAALDAVRAGLTGPAPLLRGFGLVGIVVGLWSLVGSIGDPLAARGPGLRSTDLSISLGEFNLLGAVVVLVCSVLLLLASRPGGSSVLMGRVACGLAALGAVSLHAQLGFTDPLLGGTPTSAGFLLSLGVVGLAPGLVPGARRPVHPTTTTDRPHSSEAPT